MILQPFVENAIIHGIDKTVDTWHIQIPFLVGKPTIVL